MSNPNIAFELHLLPGGTGRTIVIRAFDGFLPSDIDESGTGHSGRNPYGWTSGWDPAGRVKLTCEVTHGGVVIFPAGQLYCALHSTSDGIDAKELVMSLVAMRPGDTDADYFADYTPAQLEWATAHGEAIGVERMTRYCDEYGNVRRAL